MSMEEKAICIILVAFIFFVRVSLLTFLILIDKNAKKNTFRIFSFFLNVVQFFCLMCVGVMLFESVGKKKLQAMTILFSLVALRIEFLLANFIASVISAVIFDCFKKRELYDLYDAISCKKTLLEYYIIKRALFQKKGE